MKQKESPVQVDIVKETLTIKEESKNYIANKFNSSSIKTELSIPLPNLITKLENEIDANFLIRDTLTGIMYDARSDEFNTGAYVNPVNISEQSLERKIKLNWQLLRASESGDAESVRETLNSLKYGNLIANINVKELNDFTPLHNAVGEGYLEIIKILLEKGADVNAVTTEGRTPLHMACYNGNKEIIQCLLNKGSNINKQEKDGNTPTHILAERGWPEALSFLLEKEPDLSIKNSYGLTAPEVSTTIEIRRMFPTLKTEQSTGYNRTIVDKMIIRNNRADVVKTMMFKQLLLDNKPNKKETRTVAKEGVESRRMKVIEAARRIKDIVIAPDEENKTIGPDDFQPIRKLGRGSFGQVYLVKHKSSGKLYALKMLEKEKFMTNNLFRYATTEKDILSYSDHPFIVKLHYAFQTAKKLCFVLDYCPGY